MRWKVEIITPESGNILFDDGQPDVDSSVVGMVFPIDLAKRLVQLHNDDLDDVAVEIMSLWCL